MTNGFPGVLWQKRFELGLGPLMLQKRLSGAAENA
jgi:hypothetical protein